MKMSIIILIILMASSCYESEIERDPLRDIIVGEKTDYHCQDNIIETFTWIDQIGLWIHQNISYKTDDQHYWQLPDETLNLKTGDCADMVILHLYLAKTKLNMEMNMIIISNDSSQHALIYPYPFGSQTGYYYDVVNNFITKDILPGWHIVYSIPYSQVIWMTYYYHRNVGKYY
jgi:hypothetical protein